MILETFILEINSINNPDNRQDYLSKLIEIRMKLLEEEYYKKSQDRLISLESEILDMDLKDMTKMLKSLAKTQQKFLMVLDNLVSE